MAGKSGVDERFERARKRGIGIEPGLGPTSKVESGYLKGRKKAGKAAEESAKEAIMRVRSRKP